MRNEVENALRLDPNLAAAHSQLGRVKLNYDWDWMGADASFKKALELEPGNATTFRNAGVLAATLGRFDEAAELTRRAIELDPLNPANYSNLGSWYFSSGRLKESDAAYRKAMELNPEFPGAHFRIGLIYLDAVESASGTCRNGARNRANLARAGAGCLAILRRVRKRRQTRY